MGEHDEASCALGIPPEDIAAWALDDEAVAGLPDPVGHVAHCPACARVIASVQTPLDIAGALRHGVPAPSASVVETTMRRVRAEAGVLVLVRTLAGAAGRVGRALPGYLGGPPRS